MEKDEELTRVVFRRWSNGDVIALFPDIHENVDGDCLSYEHIGQHGEADYTSCIFNTHPATAIEYKDLFEELTSIGYNLKVCKRR